MKIVLNNNHGDFKLYPEILVQLGAKSSEEVKRNDQRLIDMIENNVDVNNTRSAFQPRIVEIPDNVHYIIIDYDEGVEMVLWSMSEIHGEEEEASFWIKARK